MACSTDFVLSLAWEGFSNVLIEARAYGCPVVSTDCPSGRPEVLEHGKFGPLVLVGDDEAMAIVINSVLDVPPCLEMLRGRATLFSVGRSVDRYEKVLGG